MILFNNLMSLYCSFVLDLFSYIHVCLSYVQFKYLILSLVLGLTNLGFIHFSKIVKNGKKVLGAIGLGAGAKIENEMGASNLSPELKAKIITESKGIGQGMREDVNNKFFENNPILESISEFKEYLSTLNTYQLCILMDIFIFLLIFICLLDIILAFYANYFIDKYSLSSRFPKLSSLIKLRVVSNHFFISINAIIIILSIFFIGYVNIATLLYA